MGGTVVTGWWPEARGTGEAIRREGHNVVTFPRVTFSRAGLTTS